MATIFTCTAYYCRYCWSRENYSDTILWCRYVCLTCIPLDRRRCTRWLRQCTALHSDTCCPHSRRSPAHSAHPRTLECTHTWKYTRKTVILRLNSGFFWLNIQTICRVNQKLVLLYQKTLKVFEMPGKKVIALFSWSKQDTHIEPLTVPSTHITRE